MKIDRLIPVKCQFKIKQFLSIIKSYDQEAYRAYQVAFLYQFVAHTSYMLKTLFL